MRTLFLFLGLISLTNANAYLIGSDERVPVIQVANPDHRRLASSVAAHFYRPAGFRKLEDYLSDLWIRDGEKVCSDLPYSQEVGIETCSSFLVGPDLILTAGHCLGKSYDTQNSMAFKRNYKFPENTRPSIYFSDGEAFKSDGDLDPERLYEGVELVAGVYERLDFALIRLDRKVRDREPLKIDWDGEVNEHDPTILVGHPHGLPLMITHGGEVTRIENSAHLRSNVSVLHGNSGGPLINLRTAEVIGITSRLMVDELPGSSWMYGPLEMSESGCLKIETIDKEQGRYLNQFSRMTAIKEFLP